MSRINGDYVNAPKINVDTKLDTSLSIGDMLSCAFTGTDKGMAILTTQDGKSFKTPAENIVGAIGETLNFKVVDTNKNSVVMKQILEEKKDKEDKSKSADLSGDELLNWAKGAVLPITGAAFRSSKIRFEENREQDIKMLDALNRIKKDISYAVNNVSKSALAALTSNGISADGVTITMLSQAIKTAVKGVANEPSAEEITDALNKFAKEDNSRIYNRSILSVKALISQDLPVTESNLDQLNSVQEKLAELNGMNLGERINFLLMDSEPTVSGLFAALHSGSKGKVKNSMTDSQFDNITDSVKKYMSQEGIEVSGENIRGARLLIENEIPVTADNLDFINGHLPLLPADRVLDAAAENMSLGLSPFKAVVFENAGFKSVNQRELFNSYKNIINALPGVSDQAVEMSVRSSEAVTIANIIKNQQFINDNGASLGPVSSQALSERVKLEEIKLRLTLGAASQMAKAGIEIDGLELQKVIDQLKNLEQRNNRTALAIAGAEDAQGNLDRLSDSQRVFKALAPTHDSVLRQVLLKEISFTAEDIYRENTLLNEREALNGYKANETAVNAKFGDGFGKVSGQVWDLLTSLGIEPDADNVMAAKSLIRTNTDVTEKNLEAIKAINSKIQFVSHNLHPVIAAEMIKDNFNPLSSHIDQVTEYINKFNEIYGEPPVEAFERAIFNMDSKNQLAKDERDSLIGMYRMLSAINKNEAVSAAVIAKSGKSLTLNNLMESGKYFDKSKGRRGIIDKMADDTARSVTLSPNSISQQIKAAYKEAVAELQQSQITEDEAKKLADNNSMGYTAQNMELIKAAADIGTGSLEKASNIRDTINALIDSVKHYEAALYYKTINEKELENTDIRKLLEGAREFMEMSAKAEADLNTSESAGFNVFKEDLESLKNVSPQQISWLNSLNLPLTIGNIKIAKEAAGDDGYLGKKLRALDEIAKDVTGGGGLEEIIPDVSSLENMDEDGAIGLINKVSEKTDQLVAKAMESDSPKKVSLLNQASIVKNASLIAEKTASGSRRYQIPVKLHDKIENLNVYLLNEDADPDNMKAFLRLNFSGLGTVEGSISVNKGACHIVISADTEAASKYLEDNRDIMHQYMADLGYKDYSLAFEGKGGAAETTRETAQKEQALYKEGNMDVRL